MTTSRRGFLGLSAMAVSGAAMSIDAAEPKKRNASDLLKVGVILGDYPHSTGWGAMINGINGNTTYPKRTGMIYTHVWHINRNEAEAFAKQYGVDEVVRNFDGMVGKVDGIIIDTIMQTPWVYKLAEPYLGNGIPVFSDRPGNDAVWKVKKLIDMAQKYNTPFWRFLS